MGLRIKRSLNIGPLRINLSKIGLGFSIGIPGYRKTLTANKRVRTTYNIPGTGISWIKEKKKNGFTN